MVVIRRVEGVDASFVKSIYAQCGKGRDRSRCSRWACDVKFHRTKVNNLSEDRSVADDVNGC